MIFLSSYNGNFRAKSAGVGDTYDAKQDKFIAPALSE
jgi:hypothetical protein